MAYSEEGNIEKLFRAKVLESDSPGFKIQPYYHLAHSFISKTERPPHSQACCEDKMIIEYVKPLLKNWHLLSD